MVGTASLAVFVWSVLLSRSGTHAFSERSAGLESSSLAEDEFQRNESLSKMTTTQCKTWCQRFAFPMLAKYHKDFEAISDPSECTNKCSELTPGTFGPDASLAQITSDESIDMMRVVPGTVSLLQISEAGTRHEGQIVAKMTSEQCKTWCQRFAFPLLAKHSKDFETITDPSACVEKCAELTPSIFSPDTSASLLQISSEGVLEPTRVPKISSVKCQTYCQHFAFSELEKYSAKFKGIDYPPACVAICKELTPKVFSPPAAL
eukprot:TRINITY_DN2447_c0_g1_i1.p1 TRINITY_DN2447_c0_g1~~TRINITY_DN2447_c0_g1_i1.p1  ORF type:complete len:262 (+),score=28.48 TRINITY_DN2447_c0_g1_i1:86-871(+)